MDGASFSHMYVTVQAPMNILCRMNLLVDIKMRVEEVNILNYLEAQ